MDLLDWSMILMAATIVSMAQINADVAMIAGIISAMICYGVHMFVKYVLKKPYN